MKRPGFLERLVVWLRPLPVIAVPEVDRSRPDWDATQFRFHRDPLEVKREPVLYIDLWDPDPGASS